MRVIALSSIKGGVGKTSAAINLARLAAADGCRTLLWDLDPQGATTYTLDIAARVAGGARQLVRAADALSGTPVPSAWPDLDVVPADFSLRYLDLELADRGKPRRQISRMLESLEPEYDIAFLDCPPGITLAIDSALRATDLVLVPVIPAALPMRSFDQLAAYMRADKRLRSVMIAGFLSMVDLRKRVHRSMVEELRAERSELMSNWTPYSVDIEEMALDRSPVVDARPSTAAAEAYRKLYHELDTRLGG